MNIKLGYKDISIGIFSLLWFILIGLFVKTAQAEEYATSLGDLQVTNEAALTSVDRFLRPTHPMTESRRPETWPARVTIEDVSHHFSVTDAERFLSGEFTLRFHCDGAPISSVALSQNNAWDGVMNSGMVYEFYINHDGRRQLRLTKTRPYLHQIAVTPPSEPWIPEDGALGRITEVRRPDSGPGFQFGLRGIRNLLSNPNVPFGIVRIRETGETAIEMGGAMNQRVCPGDKPYKLLLTSPKPIG